MALSQQRQLTLLMEKVNSDRENTQFIMVVLIIRRVDIQGIFNL